MPSVLEQRRSARVFWFGCALVTAGVILHLPMFLMARQSGFVLAGMSMDGGMLLGMATIVLGYGLSGFGLLPRTGTHDLRELESPQLVKLP